MSNGRTPPETLPPPLPTAPPPAPLLRQLHAPSGDRKGPMTMNRLFPFGALAAAAALLFGGLTRAEDKAPAKHQTYAVVVGVGTFADKEIKPRPTADEDARTIAGLLTDKGVGGVPHDHMAVLLSKADEKFGAKEGTKDNILKAVGEAAKKVGKDDTLL